MFPHQDARGSSPSPLPAGDIKFVFGHFPQCEGNNSMHMYDFEEFTLLESGSAAGRGKQYGLGEYCIEVRQLKKEGIKQKTDVQGCAEKSDFFC